MAQPIIHDHPGDALAARVILVGTAVVAALTLIWAGVNVATDDGGEEPVEPVAGFEEPGTLPSVAPGADELPSTG